MDHQHEQHHDHATHVQAGRLRRFWTRIKLYVLSWLSVTGLVATTSTCPFCGQAGCPVGLGQAAGLGVVAAAALWVLNKLGLRKKPAQARRQ